MIPAETQLKNEFFLIPDNLFENWNQYLIQHFCADSIEFLNNKG